MIPYYTRFFFIAMGIILLQVLVFDQMNLFGYSNPSVYVLLLIIYRLDLDQFGFIIIAFFLGFFVDLITQTAGANSLACVSIAFIRPLISRFALGTNYDQPNAVFTNTLLSNRLLYYLLMIVIHHLIYSFMAYFSIDHFGTILLYTMVNSILSWVLITASISLLKPKK